MSIQVEHLRRSFYDVLAVSDISFQAEPGKIVGLVGPNGSGKTTLFLMLAGLLAPDSGKIVFDNLNIENDPQKYRKHIGWMPDELGTWESITPREILHFFGKAYGISTETASVRTTILLEKMELVSLADRPARVLSRGQKQKLSFARALVHNPKLLLLDEPANGLDPRARIELRIFLREYAQQGNTVIVSSHILSELEDMVDEAVFLNNGATVPRPIDKTNSAFWQIECLDKDALLQWAQTSGVSITVTHNEQILVEVSGAEAAAHVLEQLVKAGLKITGFMQHKKSLEETFMSLDNDNYEERLEK